MRNLVGRMSILVCAFLVTISVGFAAGQGQGNQKEFDCEKIPTQEACESGKAKTSCTWYGGEKKDGFCTFTPVCGDGTLQYTEECDDGNDVDTDACTSECKPAYCGDGIVYDGVEECDGGDDCTATCTLIVCGDGKVEGDEECDGGDDCTEACTLIVCGDGKVEGDEECDGGDDCSDTCRIEFCGDGIIQPGEFCDDGNDSNNDACTNTCQRARCGDGFVNPAREQCDDGNNNDADSCTNRCRDAVCGDGIVQEGVEECDGGEGCSEECTLIDVCPEIPETGSEGIGETYGYPYVVCSADAESAWVSGRVRGQYNALEICNGLGYDAVTARGGHCGTVCGYCGEEGLEEFDGLGYVNDNLIRYTVHWLCEEPLFCS